MEGMGRKGVERYFAHLAIAFCAHCTASQGNMQVESADVMIYSGDITIDMEIIFLSFACWQGEVAGVGWPFS